MGRVRERLIVTFWRSIISLHLCKEYLTVVKFKASFVLLNVTVYYNVDMDGGASVKRGTLKNTKVLVTRD